MSPQPPLPLLYTELAPWWPLVSRPQDYAEEARTYGDLLQATGERTRLLELGSGGGNNASHLKWRFEMTLVDLSNEMLDVSRRANPECEHVQGDMRAVRLGREFDAVFVHDALMYLTTEADLQAAIRTAVAHCRKGGAVVFAPDYFREGFRPECHKGGHDGDGRSVRYIQWDCDPDAADTWYWADFVLLLREGKRPARVVHERHELGLFPRETWLELCRKEGLDPRVLTPAHSEVGQLNLILAEKRD